MNTAMNTTTDPNHTTDTDLAPPGFPSVAGQRQPDLDLASFAGWQTDMTQLSPSSPMGGHVADSTPPQRSGMMSPDELRPYDIGAMGISASANAIPFFDLDLAGASSGFLSPGEVTARDQGPAQMHEPSYLAPDFTSAQLRPGMNLTGPGIDLVPAFAADPYTGGLLLGFDTPKGLDMLVASDSGVQDLMRADPDDQPDLGDYDRPGAGLQLPPASDGLLALVADPALPDLQHPSLQQDVEMQTRPGDLAEDALSEMHAGADDQAVQQSQYPDVQFDQRGDNQARRRHQELMQRGLDATGIGKEQR